MLSRKEYLHDFPKVCFTNVGPAFVLLTNAFGQNFMFQTEIFIFIKQNETRDKSSCMASGSCL